MEITAEKFTRLLLSFVLIVSISVAVFGISPTIMGMEMNSKEEMSPCPFSGVTAICRMSPLEHITAWQKIFTALPLKNISILAILLLLAVFSIFFLWDLWSKNNLQAIPFHRQRFRYGYVVRRKLQEAFSNGILDPKIF